MKFTDLDEKYCKNWITNTKGTRLSVKTKGLTSLSGIDEFKNLEFLQFDNNNISNIDEIAELPKLKKLIGTGNKIVNMDAVSSLTNLEEIHLGYNKIKNIPDLSKLKKLRRLTLWYNHISKKNGKTVFMEDEMKDLIYKDVPSCRYKFGLLLNGNFLFKEWDIKRMGIEGEITNVKIKQTIEQNFNELVDKYATLFVGEEFFIKEYSREDQEKYHATRWESMRTRIIEFYNSHGILPNEEMLGI